MKILGLTGDIAAGKSTVARLLQSRGAAILDADLLVRELYSDRDFARSLAARFGDILAKDGSIEHSRLSAIVFEDKVKLAELESIVHPAVADLRASKLNELQAAGALYVVLEAVKLLESGQGKGCDEVWCVTAWGSLQIARMIKNRNLTRDDAQRRLNAQPSPEAKRALAGNVPLVFLPNNGSLASLESRVEREWVRFTRNDTPSLSVTPTS